MLPCRGGEGSIEPIVVPQPGRVIEAVTTTDDELIVTVLENVIGKVYRFSRTPDGWQGQPVAFPDNGIVEVMTTRDDDGSFFARYESFTQPPTLYHVTGGSLNPDLVTAQDAGVRRCSDGGQPTLDNF